MNIVVCGYSGCGIVVRAATPEEFQATGVRNILEKTSASVAYNPRLHKQLDKQEQYSLKLLNHLNKREGNVEHVSSTAPQSPSALPPDVHVPQILFRKDGFHPQTLEPLPTVCGMVFEHHVDCITFLGTSPIHDLNAFLDSMIRLLQLHIRLSPMTPVATTVFTSKIDDMIQVMAKNSSLSDKIRGVKTMLGHFSAWISKESEHMLPIGCCHGDLTLTNVLIQRQPKQFLEQSPTLRIVLIDFLDSFVESPLADIAKLCQDIVYGWSLRHVEGPVDRARIYIVYARLEDKLMKHCEKYEWFRKYFRFFFAINQLRVLQYSKNAQDAEYLYRSGVEQFRLWAETNNPTILPECASL